MAVDLKFYHYDVNTKQKTLITNGYNLGNLFKGSQKKFSFTIYNDGDTTAVSPFVSFKRYQSNSDKPIEWKSVSFMENSNYDKGLELPDIKPKSWLTGKDVYSEDFQGYPVIAGTPLSSDWLTWQGVDKTWEVYNGWLQHNVDIQDSKAKWTALPSAKDYFFSMNITIRDGCYGGLLVRDTGDNDTGYIILIQGVASRLGDVASNEGIIQIYKGSFMSGINSWTLVKQSGSTGIRGTHDYMAVKLSGNTIQVWYKNKGNPILSYIDEEETYTDARIPILLCSAGSGSVLSYFDDLYMEVENDDGVIWVKNEVDESTPLFGTQRTLLDITYGGE